MMIYDAIVIGTGPAGFSAALNLKIHNKKLLWIGSRELSDKVTLAEKIENYPGLVAVSGREMRDVFQKQIGAMGLEITEHMVNSVMPVGDHYAVMAGPEFYEAYTVILATGVAMANALPGEKEMLGRGVSYCATCDGRLYRGKTIAVISNHRRFEHEVAYLADLAGEVLYFARYKNPSTIAENVKMMEETAVAVKQKDGRVEGILLKDGSTALVDGVFCLRNSISLATLLPQLSMEDGHIAVDRQQRTNLAGCFAAGDCTGRPYQYAKAVGEGNVAAHSVIGYLDALQKK